MQPDTGSQIFSSPEFAQQQLAQLRRNVQGDGGRVSAEAPAMSQAAPGNQVQQQMLQQNQHQQCINTSTNTTATRAPARQLHFLQQQSARARKPILQKWPNAEVPRPGHGSPSSEGVVED